MNAPDIRGMAIARKTQYGDPIENTGVEEFVCAMLQEIAAQLAELNLKLDTARTFNVEQK